MQTITAPVQVCRPVTRAKAQHSQLRGGLAPFRTRQTKYTSAKRHMATKATIVDDVQDAINKNLPEPLATMVRERTELQDSMRPKTAGGSDIPPTPMGLAAPSNVPSGLNARITGFYDAAEISNGRAAMVGFFALLLLESIIPNGGILDLMGVETGVGINLGF